METNDAGGLVEEVDAAPADAVAHAFDPRAEAAPHAIDSAFTVQAEHAWQMPLERGRRCPLCAEAVPPHS
ncbi:hypothetical protein [Streptomyces sp. NPDC049813]|uniref:hypothetical protein n=1 Tax=Streptomyces sp. NPDC049813 TaxID=3365597 RepID=UPI0037B2C1D3